MTSSVRIDSLLLLDLTLIKFYTTSRWNSGLTALSWHTMGTGATGDCGRYGRGLSFTPPSLQGSRWIYQTRITTRRSSRWRSSSRRGQRYASSTTAAVHINTPSRFATFIDAGANTGASTNTSAVGATAYQNVSRVLWRLFLPATPHLLQKRGAGSCRICLWNCWKAARASVLALIFSVVGVAAYQILWCAMRRSPKRSHAPASP